MIRLKARFKARQQGEKEKQKYESTTKADNFLEKILNEKNPPKSSAYTRTRMLGACTCAYMCRGVGRHNG